MRARTFPTQPLTLPKGMVDLDAPTLARVETEREELKAALAAGAAERLWRGPFRIPVEGGQPTGGFGLRRILNGKPRSPHTGYDWAAPAGTPVLAANTGRAALVAEHFFAGRNVVLDHGLGLSPSTSTSPRPASPRESWSARVRSSGRSAPRAG